MQQFDKVIADKPNGNGWRVHHDTSTQMYYLKNDNGNRLNEVFTKRVFAEARLAKYLEDIQSKKPSKKSEKQKQAEAEWQDKNSTSPSTDLQKD